MNGIFHPYDLSFFVDAAIVVEFDNPFFLLDGLYTGSFYRLETLCVIYNTGLLL